MRYRIVLCGFSEFEYRAMHFSFQQPASSDETGYEVVDGLAEADFAIVDADSKPAVKGVVLSNRVAHAVFVGASPPLGASLHLPRPIDPTRIRRLLDALSLRFPETRVRLDPPAELSLPTLDDVVPSRYEPHEPVFTPEPPAAAAPVAAPVPAPKSAAAPAEEAEKVAPPPPLVPDRPSAEPDPEAAAEAAAHAAAKAKARAAARRARLASNAVAASSAALLRDVMVLDADEEAGALLGSLLERFGFNALVVRSISSANEQLASRPFAAFFLDIALDGADRGEGLALVQRIQELPLPEGRPAPAVLMVSSQLNPADRVRAALAGIQVPLIKPVSRGDVARALEGCGVSLPADARRR